MNAADDIGDDRARGIEDPKVFLELGVIGIEERLIEVDDGISGDGGLRIARAKDILDINAALITNPPKTE